MKKIKPLTETELSELPKLPEGWKWVKLGEHSFVTKLAGFEFTKHVNYKEKEMGDIPVIRAQNVSKGGFIPKNFIYVDRETMEKLPRSRIRGGEILMVFVGSVGNVGIVPYNNEYFLGPNVAKIDLEKHLNNKYVLFFLSSTLGFGNVSGMAKATTQSSISMSNIREVGIPLVALKEQCAIVSKIEQLFSELDNGIANLKLAQAQLKVYRQAVLKKAFEGFRKVQFSEFVVTSQNGIAKRNGKEGSEVKVLRLADINNMEIDYGNPRCIKLTSSEIKKYKLFKDDLICIRVNGSINLVGRLIIANENDELNNWGFCDHFIRISLDHSKIIPRFYFYYFQTMEVRQYIHENMVSSAGQNSISQKTIKSVLVPVATLIEQQAIVTEIETRLSVCDKVEQDIEDNLKIAEALRQSILKKAFEGKLLNERELEEVRSAPDWEPAEALLGRIRAEKAIINKNKGNG